MCDDMEIKRRGEEEGGRIRSNKQTDWLLGLVGTTRLEI